jgi:hypothetical protein
MLPYKKWRLNIISDRIMDNCMWIEQGWVWLSVVMVKADFWKRWAGTPLNERQIKLINRLLDDFDGKLTSRKCAVIAKCSSDTALRDANDLIARGLMRKSESGGRSTNYELTKEWNADSIAGSGIEPAPQNSRRQDVIIQTIATSREPWNPQYSAPVFSAPHLLYWHWRTQGATPPPKYKSHRKGGFYILVVVSPPVSASVSIAVAERHKPLRNIAGFAIHGHSFQCW